MENNLIETPNKSLDMFTYAADLMLRQDKNSYEVKTALMANGVEEKDALYIIETIEEQIEAARSGKAKKDMLYGAIWCIGGILVTLFTYSSASNGGGSYVVAWGAILFGGVQFVRGLINS